ncbi:hypothetical protein PQO03_18670 [Lentisphaera profundi]|uniref:VPDSG-CTERM protein sorting domain-containing protein n=1 Tax=Lentisphaera profundi TaxID=1658616 RepID=A0ABY7VVW0_9BACT|nr:hypothetical protein [Lentisphaera profundi]WDE97852.1 hypothetical protein PQO03_18670 [Lentisphaera profundi]
MKTLLAGAPHSSDYQYDYTGESRYEGYNGRLTGGSSESSGNSDFWMFAIILVIALCLKSKPVWAKKKDL